MSSSRDGILMADIDLNLIRQVRDGWGFRVSFTQNISYVCWWTIDSMSRHGSLDSRFIYTAVTKNNICFRCAHDFRIMQKNSPEQANTTTNRMLFEKTENHRNNHYNIYITECKSSEAIKN